MPKTEGRGSSGRLTESELMGEMGGNISSVITPTPSSQGSPKTTFDCPLCVEFFWQFPQLKRHLLYMHPRRDMIMKLVKERYGDSVRLTFARNPTMFLVSNFFVFVEETQRKLHKLSLGCSNDGRTLHVPYANI